MTTFRTMRGLISENPGISKAEAPKYLGDTKDIWEIVWIAQGYKALHQK